MSNALKNLSAIGSEMIDGALNLISDGGIKKMTKSEAILDYYKQYPESTIKQIAKATSSTTSYVRNVIKLNVRPIILKKKKVPLAPKKVRLAPKTLVNAPIRSLHRNPMEPQTMYESKIREKLWYLPNKTDERLLRLKHVLEIIPVSKSSWWAGVKEGKYPASVKCGSSTFWRFSDISTLVKTLGIPLDSYDQTKRKVQELAVSDGSTASYYELPKDATELQHLISDKNMNAQIGEIFRSCYRYGESSHSDALRDAKKIKFYIDAEIARLER